MSNYKVRFNLSAGENYKKWQIKNGKEVKFYDPDEVDIIMKNCRLKNRRQIAEKIFAGENKSVCAWIEAESVWVHPKTRVVSENIVNISYNPKKSPFWTNEDGDNLDDNRYALLHTSGKTIISPFSKRRVNHEVYQSTT